MTEKDTFGDKLRDKEKADEDRYFAERDRELIAKRKAQMTEDSEAEQRESAHMRCPKCGELLSADTVRDVHVEVCDRCHGVWLERDEIEQLVGREQGGWLTRCFERIRGR